MSNRTAKFVSAIFASLLAGAPFATTSRSAAAECLSGPTDQTPGGSHWYYRIEHPSERHCWYLRKEGDKLAQVAPPNSAPVAKPVSPTTRPAIQRSIADAHAELPQDTGVTAGQRPAIPAIADTAVTDTAPANAGTAIPQAPAQASVVTSRWPGQPDMSSPVGPQAAATVAVANAPSKAAAAPAVAAVTLATADASSKNQFGSIQMLLTIVMGALSLAVVMGSVIFRFGRTRWRAKPETRKPRRVNWGSSNGDSLARSVPTQPRMSEGDIPRDPRAADDPDRRIAEMLARLARSAAA